jgi:3-polyprenyl-4-hydroxybenzoate decarboxylase
VLEGTKTNPISTVPLGVSGVIYDKKNTKYYEILQKNTKKPKIYSRKVPVSHHFLSKMHQKTQTFALIYPPKMDFYSQIQKSTHISQVSESNTLNSMYKKDLHNFLPPRHAIYAIRNTRKRTQSHERSL